MRILITGSSGQLGAEVARQLAVAGHDPLGLDTAPGPWTTHVASLLERTPVAALLARVDAVVHTAALHARHLAWHSPQEFIAVNVVGTRRLLTGAARAGVRSFVFTSTASVYGDAAVPTDRAVWVTEDLAPRPRDIYDGTKLAAEGLCRLFARESGMAITCLRPGRFFPQPPEALAWNRLYRGVDVRDVAAAHLLALTRTGPTFGIFTIAARSPFTEADLPALLDDAPAVVRRGAPGVAHLFEARGWPLPARIDRVYATARAERVLGYRPRHNADDYARALLSGPLVGVGSV